MTTTQITKNEMAQILENVIDTMTEEGAFCAAIVHELYETAEKYGFDITVLSSYELVDAIPSLKRSHLDPDAILEEYSSLSFDNKYVIIGISSDKLIQEITYKIQDECWV